MTKYDNVYEILSIPLALYMAYDKAKADGKVDASDIQYLVGPLLRLPSAIDGADQALSELKSLDDESRAKCMAQLAADFDIADDVLEKKIEAAVNWLLATGELLGVFEQVEKKLMPTDTQSKSLLKSKTFWVAIGILVISSVEGPLQGIIKDQPPIFGAIVSVLMIVLRFLTSQGVKIK